MISKEFNDVSILIVTYKSDFLIFKTLEGLKKIKNILIVDNSNNKKLGIKIKKKYKNIKFFSSRNNKGYGAGNNFLLKKVKTKYALILNPDCFVHSNEIKKILNFVKMINDDFAIIGHKYKAKTILNKIILKNKYWISENVRGFFMFLNLKKFKKISFFDENFFLYLEEIDLCKRVRLSKEKIIALDSINLKSLGAKSSYDREEFEKLQSWHWMWSKFYFSRKHKGYFLSFIIFIPKLLSLFFKRLIYKDKVFYLRFEGLYASMTNKKSYYRGSI